MDGKNYFEDEEVPVNIKERIDQVHQGKVISSKELRERLFPKPPINLETKYYYIINQDLKMSKGKIAAQVSHVAMQLGAEYGEIGRAIVLKATEVQIKAIMVNSFSKVFTIHDAGLTEVPAGSLTCVGFKSDEKSKIMEKKMIEHLRLV